jgi:hypothetical protein
VRRSLVHFAELDKEQFSAAKALIACVELRSVRFTRFSFTSNLGARTDPEGNIEVSSSSRSTQTIDSGFLKITYDLGIQGHQEDVLIMNIGARIEVLYAVPEEQSFNDSQMKAFARSNGMLNVWPYWREYVQSSTQRAGLASLTLPLFRVVPKSTKPKSKLIEQSERIQD